MPTEMRKRDDVARILRRVGFPEVADAAVKALPDPATLDEVIRFLGPYGISLSVLTDRMGASP